MARPGRRLAAFGAALILVACRGDGPATVRIGTSEPPRADCVFGAAEREYEGTATVQVSYSDAFGERYDRTYERTDAGFELGPPVTGEGGNEPNPLHLSFGTETQSAAGSFLGISAVPFVDPEDGVHVTFDYWTLTATCDSLSGTLTQDHADAGVGFVNGIMAPKNLGAGLGFVDWPFVMAAGTTVEGTASGVGARLVVRGTDVEGLVRFTITIEAA